MKKTFFSLLVIFTVIFTGCTFTPTADQIQQQKQEESQKQAVQSIGIPATPNHTELRQVFDLYQKRDDAKLICYAYIFSEMQCKLKFLGRCQGFGIPYATQFSSPSKIQSNGNGGILVPQAEPNGLFMPAQADATWIILLDKNGLGHPLYCEPKIIVSEVELDIKTFNNQ